MDFIIGIFIIDELIFGVCRVFFYVVIGLFGCLIFSLFFYSFFDVFIFFDILKIVGDMGEGFLIGCLVVDFL